MKPSLDIVIVNWNAGRQLYDCLNSIALAEQGNFALSRVVVVDNASAPGSLEGLEAAGAVPLTLIRNPHNRGFAAACNQGAARSRADYLLFLNPDTRLSPASLETALAFMQEPENADVAVCGVPLRDDTGQISRTCARFPRPAHFVVKMLGLDYLLPRLFQTHLLTDWDHADTREVDHVIGAFYLIRRPVFVAVGGFDERFFVYLEDLDLSLRVRQAGGRIMYCVDAPVYHKGGGNPEQVRATRLFYALRSRILYGYKHFGFVPATLLALGTLLIEPVTRLARAALHRSAPEAVETLRGMARLWASPPGPDTLMRVLVLTRYDRLGASSRVRFLQYLPYLKARGFSIQVAPLLDDDYVRGLYGGRRKHYADILRAYRERIRLLRQSRSRFDLVWIEKELFPWLPAWGERWLNRLGVPYVVDYDDATFHQYDRHRRGGVRRLLGGKIDEVMRRAALVVVGSDYLAERARQAGAGRVEYLPTVIDLDRYTATPKSENDLFTIGWIGVPVTAPFLEIVGPALAVVCRGGVARVVLVGAGAGKPDGVPGQVRPWSEETEVSEVQSFDAGIMPLPDAPFERGKCGYKLIQYMACGRPVVASPVGINGKIVEEGVNGFLAAGPEDWTRALCALRDNPALRERMGREARKKVEREYCLQVTAPRLLRLLQSVPAR